MLKSGKESIICFSDLHAPATWNAAVDAARQSHVRPAADGSAPANAAAADPGHGTSSGRSLSGLVWKFLNF